MIPNGTTDGQRFSLTNEMDHLQTGNLSAVKYLQSQPSVLVTRWNEDIQHGVGLLETLQTQGFSLNLPVCYRRLSSGVVCDLAW